MLLHQACSPSLFKLKQISIDLRKVNSKWKSPNILANRSRYWPLSPFYPYNFQLFLLALMCPSYLKFPTCCRLLVVRYPLHLFNVSGSAEDLHLGWCGRSTKSASNVCCWFHEIQMGLFNNWDFNFPCSWPPFQFCIITAWSVLVSVGLYLGKSSIEQISWF